MNGIRPTGRALLGALVSGALATGAIGGAAPAEASCISVFGFGNGNGCTSSQTSYAIGIGDGAVASATGLFGGALAFGTNSNASTASLGLSAFNFATAIGDDATALGNISLFGIALQLGPGTAGTLGMGNIAIGAWEGTGQQAGASGVGGIAIQLGPGSAATIGAFSIAMGVSPESAGIPETATGGFGNLALNLFGGASPEGGTRVATNGFLSAAVNFLGNDNVVTAEAPGLPTLNLAWNAFGSGNTVKAGPGPLAIAGSIFQRGATVTKVSPGFNINGLAVPGVASVPRPGARPASAAATAQPSAAKAVSSPGGAREGRKSRR